MLCIGKKITDLLDYIEKLFLEQQTSLEEPYRLIHRFPRITQPLIIAYSASVVS